MNETDSTGAMAAAWFGTPGTENAVEKIFGKRARAPERDARRVVEAWLDKYAPGYPTYTLAEDGDDGWAFWIVPQDTTSYVGPDLRIQWLGTGWPDYYNYDGITGEWRESGVA